MGVEYRPRGIGEKCVQIFFEREGQRPRGRPMHKLEDNIRMNLREVGWEGVDWMLLY
jgi:ribosomal protein S18 acetylase RimI-like enzyme